MQMIELNCPQCQEMLEIDGGFAGGVCRCSHCGALMTVPMTADGTPETLSRPAAPGDDPRAESPLTQSRTTDNEFVSDNFDNDDDDEATSGLAAALMGEIERFDVPSGTAAKPQIDTFVTESGRVVTVDKRNRIPTARKRNQRARVITYLTAGLVALIIVATGAGLSVYFLSDIFSRGTAVDPDLHRVIEPAFVYDKNRNPYHIELANVIGLPLIDNTVTVVDCSDASSEWMELVEGMLIDGAEKITETTEYRIILTNGDDSRTVGGNNWATGNTAELKAAFTRIAPKGEADIAKALKSAQDFTPNQIILITSRTLDDKAVGAVGEVLGKTEISEESEKAEESTEEAPTQQGPVFHVLSIESESRSLFKLAQTSQGRAEVIPLSFLKTWTRYKDE